MSLETKAPRDLRGPATNSYISIMLLIFPLFTGFSGYANITFSKYVFFVGATGLWLAALAVLSICPRQPLPRLRGCHWAALAFGVVCLLSWALSPYRSESLIGAGRYDGLVSQLLYVCIFLGVSLFGSLRKSHFACLGVSAGLCSAVAIVQLFGIDIFGLFPGDYCHYDSGIRYSGAFLGTMGNTNVLSAFYCLALPVLFALPVMCTGRSARLALIPASAIVFVLIRARVAGGFVGLGFGVLVAMPLVLCELPRLRRALGSACPLLLSAAAALAFSPEYSLADGLEWSFRFGTLSLFCILLAAACAALAFALGRVRVAPSKRVLRRIFAALSLLLLIAALVFVYFSPAGSGTIYELSQVLHGNIGEKFGSSRVLIWRECLSVFGDSPLLGSGPDTLALRVDVEFSRYVEETGKTLRSGVDNAHNEYLGYLINTGALGLAAYLALLFLCARAWLRRLDDSAACILGLGLLCYCAQSFFALGLPLVTPLLWISLGLVCSASRELCKPISE